MKNVTQTEDLVQVASRDCDLLIIQLVVTVPSTNVSIGLKRD